jgi:DNA-binding NtrC family response regulator
VRRSAVDRRRSAKRCSRRASGGTLFLDEVGELPPAAQVKLLRAIQEGEVEPVGARRPVKVDVRLISATNRNLIEDVKQGRFREDLFYRLHVYPIGVPPLRSRPEDISDLVRHFLARFAAEEGKRIRSVSAEAAALLRAFTWPGNVRQLENAVFRAVVLAESDEIGAAEFPQIASQLARPNVAEPAEEADPALAVIDAPLFLEPPAEPQAEPYQAAAELGPGSGHLALLDERDDVRPLDQIEADVIRFAIAHYRGQMSEVARKLRIGRSTLYRKLEGLEFASDAGESNETGVAAR